jgi:hypothetical protein
MVTHCLIVSRQHNRSASCSRLPASSQVTKSPVVHPLLVQPLTKCLFRNSFVLKTIHLSWGACTLACTPRWLCPRPSSPQLPILISPISYLLSLFFIPLRTLLHFFALMQNSTPFFSCVSALFAKNYPRWGHPSKLFPEMSTPTRLLASFPHARSYTS